jgi:oligoribonuclease NrnB/cAMP/cGMP phosphodiesterase (DHH superfamily)
MLSYIKSLWNFFFYQNIEKGKEIDNITIDNIAIDIKEKDINKYNFLIGKKYKQVRKHIDIYHNIWVPGERGTNFNPERLNIILNFYPDKREIENYETVDEYYKDNIGEGIISEIYYG